MTTTANTVSCNTAKSVRRTTAVLLVALVASLLGSAGPWTRSAEAATYVRPTLSTFDSHLLMDINHARAARGLNRLTVVAGTTDIAHGWSCHLASYRLLAHNGSLGALLATHGSSGWRSYGENIGYVRSSRYAYTLFNAYMRSPAHRANILD